MKYFRIICMTAISLCYSFSLAAQEPLPTISVSGSADILVVPDYVVLFASIESRDKDLSVAVTDNDKRIEQVVKFLGESGVEAKHIRTERMTITPIYPEARVPKYAQMAVQSDVPAPAVAVEDEFEKIKPIGYTTSRQFEITVNDISKFESLYRTLIERGINNVSGVQFKSTELRKHRDEARLQSIRAAREKATAMAQELGVTLSGVKSISESGSDGGSWRAQSNFASNAYAEAPSDESMSGGGIKISATVDVVFYLDNKGFVKPKNASEK